MNLEQIQNIKLHFILTTARTGSTMLSSMLNAHPNVISTIEEPFAYNLYPKYHNIKNWTSETIQNYCYDFYLFSEGRLGLQFSSKKELEKLLETYKSQLNYTLAIRITYLCFFPTKDKSDISTVVDKQLLLHPCIEDVASCFPESKFIILLRDPRDNAFTKWRMFEKKKEFKEQNYYRIALYWQHTYEKLIGAKKKFGADRFLEIKYEDLVRDPEFELRKMCSFLSISYTEQMMLYTEKVKEELDYAKNYKENEAITNYFKSFHQGLSEQPKTNKIGYWKQELEPAESNLIWRICGTLASEVGYTADSSSGEISIPLRTRLSYIRFFYERVKTRWYYQSPFFVKYFIKKIKYGRNFKPHVLSTKKFYKESFTTN